MEVKIKNPGQKANLNPQTPQTQNSQTPQINQIKTNPNPQIDQNIIDLLQQLLEKVGNVRQQTQQILSQGLYPQPQPQQNEFIVKSSMKSSVLALRIEQLLIQKKKVVFSALGYAIPILVDAILLTKKDLAKLGKEEVKINLELFEKEVSSDGKKKIISGIRAILQI